MEIDALVLDHPDRTHTGRVDPQVVVQELFQTHRTEFHKRALKLTRNASDASDLLQDTLERAIRYMPDGFTPAVAKCWFYVTMRNLFLDRQKAYATRCRADLSEDDFANIAAAEPETSHAQNLEVQRELHLAIECLDSSLRDVVHLRLFDELSLAEIAERLNLQPATIGSRLFRAKQKLHHLLVTDTSRV
jgi:RNA polymerase sigma-70 factor, ECF subfamily